MHLAAAAGRRTCAAWWAAAGASTSPASTAPSSCFCQAAALCEGPARACHLATPNTSESGCWAKQCCTGIGCGTPFLAYHARELVWSSSAASHGLRAGHAMGMQRACHSTCAVCARGNLGSKPFDLATVASVPFSLCCADRSPSVRAVPEAALRVVLRVYYFLEMCEVNADVM